MWNVRSLLSRFTYLCYYTGKHYDNKNWWRKQKHKVLKIYNLKFILKMLKCSNGNITPKNTYAKTVTNYKKIERD